MLIQSVEQAERHVDIRRVELTAHQVGTYEPPVEALAEPIPVLRLQRPVAQTLARRRLPRVEPIEDLHGMLPCKRQLCTDVWCCRCPI